MAANMNAHAPERLTEFREQLQQSRQSLEALAARAARLRSRLQADTGLVESMQRLAAEARRPAHGTGRGNGAPGQSEDAREDIRDDDGSFFADGWEIELAASEDKF